MFYYQTVDSVGISKVLTLVRINDMMYNANAFKSRFIKEMNVQLAYFIYQGGMKFWLP